MKRESGALFFDVSIGELFFLAVRQWRKILILGFAAAILLGAYKFLPLYIRADTLSVTEREEAKDSLEQMVARLEREYEMKEKELAESIYYNIESSMIIQGTSLFYIDAPADEFEQKIERQKDLLFTYRTFFDSGEIYNSVADKLNTYVEPEYLKQIVSTKIDTESSSGCLKIHVIGYDRAKVNEIMQRINEEVLVKKSDIGQIVFPHAIRQVLSSITIISNEDLKEDKERETDNLNRIKTELDGKTAELQAFSPGLPTFRAAVVLGVKCAAVGMLLAVLLFAALIIFSNKIISKTQLADAFSFPVAGHYITSNKKKNKFDLWVSRRLHEPYGLSKEALSLVVASNIAGYAKAGSLLLLPCRKISGLADLRASVAGHDALKNISVDYCENSVDDGNTLALLGKADAVIIVAKRGGTSVNELRDVAGVVRSYKKDVLGLILEW